MNEETIGRRRSGGLWRAGILAVALAGICLLAGACGDSPDKERVGGSNGQVGAADRYKQALAFSKCMRSHGDPSFPDPGPGGAFPNDNGSLDKSSPQFKKAQAACKDFELGGPPPAATLQEHYKKLLKYSACMRAHGMPKFPDPVLEKDGVGTTGETDVKSPQFKAAHEACKSLMPGAA